jgi:hypothetical protein
MEYRFQDLPTTNTAADNAIDKCHVYLAKRGIKIPDIDELGIRIHLASHLGKYDDRAAVVFPHFNIQGEPIDWWSARLVDVAPPATGWNAIVPKQRGKMYCPPKEPPAAYLVPTLDWASMPKESVVFIHESCIKAIAGARCGYYSVGLNGVWGWGSKKHGIELLSQIKDLPWQAKKLRCVVVFDSNASSNDDVALAIRRFSERMQLICKVSVEHLLLPKPPEDFGQADWGFDDYCVHYGDQAGQQFLEGLDAAVPVDIGELETLRLQLNEEVCIVRELKKVVEQRTGVIMGRSEFCDMNYADYTAWVPRGETDVQVNVPKLWLTWERRRVVQKIEYMPGEDILAHGCLNMWRGMGLDPAEGPVDKWLHILEHNVPDPKLRKWILQWMAYPLQRLGTKLTTYLHLYGPPGTGKQALLAPLMRIYGNNAVIIGKEHLASDFNSIYANKQFINADELHGGGSDVGVKINNKMKRIVTQETMTVNRKGDPEYDVRNCAQVVTTSNYVDSIKLDDDDRRACVVKFGKMGEQLSKEFWLGYFRWLDEQGGASAVYQYLLGVDMLGFDPKGWAPMTEEKKLVTEATRSAVEQWVDALWEDPDGVLPGGLGKRCIFTNDELSLWAFSDDAAGVTPSKKIRLGITMHSRGFTRHVVKLGGKTTKVWAVRDRDAGWDTKLILAHLSKFSIK